jgi:hypothetical protein
MGPCATCGQLTELEADFCPACAGYAAPATVYSYAPSRLSRSDSGLEHIQVALSLTREPSLDYPPDEPVGAWRRPEPSQAVQRGRSQARDLAARLGASGRRRYEGRWLVAAGTLTVLIIAAGTALLQLGRAGHVSSPPARPAARTSGPAASVTAPPTPGPQVSVAPQAASSPYETAVLSFLASYFTAINDHDFTAYQELFRPELRAAESSTAFSAGYGTTTDSAITLTSIGVIGSGELVAQVAFVSHQQPAASPTNSACTEWTVSLYLLQQAGSYELQQPPPGYGASYAACS